MLTLDTGTPQSTQTTRGMYRYILRDPSTIQHNTTQHNTTQHNTTQHNTTQQVIIFTLIRKTSKISINFAYQMSFRAF